MMTFKQESYINALLDQKETELTPDIELFLQRSTNVISKAVASGLIEYLLICPDKTEKTDVVKVIEANKKALISKIMNKKDTTFRFKAIKLNIYSTNKHLNYEKATEEQLEAFIELAKEYKVKGL